MLYCIKRNHCRRKLLNPLTNETKAAFKPEANKNENDFA